MILKLCLLLILSTLVGCVNKPAYDLETFYAYRPKSILVLPVINESPEISAAQVFITSITRPLAERGYYVFPVYLTDFILRDFGLVEAGHIHQLPAQRFFEIFGADAALFVTIKDWSTKYILISSKVRVEMEYRLIDTRTGTLLWENTQSFEHNSDGGGYPLGMVISAAIDAMTVDYLPLARHANFLVMKPPKGIPAGQYHPDYLTDQDQF